MNETRIPNGPSGARRFPSELCRTLSTRKQAVQIVAVLTAIAISLGIGGLYADEPFISIYPMLMWLLSVGTCFGVLYLAQGPRVIRFDGMWIWLSVLFIVALILRLFKLQTLPPGFHVDESGLVDFTLRHVFHPSIPGQTLNPFRTATDSQPIMFAYIVYASVRLAGLTLAGARISSAIAGALAVPAVFLLVNEAAGRRTAWLTAVLMAVYHYHVHWSRIVLNNIWVTLLMPLVLGFFLLGWRKKWTGGAAFAGLFLGFSAYFYAGGYIIILLMPIIIWQLWHRADDRAGFGIYTAKMVALALVVAGPLLIFAARFPNDFFARAGTIAAWKPRAIEVTVGRPDAYGEFFIYQLKHSLGAYNVYSDVPGFYAPGIPFLIGMASILFLLGIGWAIYEKQALPLIWIGLVTFLGGFMVVGSPASSHFIAAVPAICWLIAIPLNRLIAGKRAGWVYALLAMIIFLDLFFYFFIYAGNPSPELSEAFPLVEPYIP
ncbi:MAG: glycosyltransferase family 39 protein [Chloroflexota bacterium]